MLRNMIRNYLSSSTDLSKDSLLRLKFMIVNSYTIIGCSYVFAHGIFNLLRQFSILGGLEIFGGILVIINILILRKTKNIEFAGGVILFLMLCLFLSLVVFGNDDKTGLFWFFTYPLLAFFLKGIPRGFLWIVFQFLLIIGMTVMSELHFLIRIPYSVYEIVILCMSILAGILLLFFYELMKNEFIDMQKKRLDNDFDQRILKEQFAIAERIQQLLIPQEDKTYGNLSISGYYKPAAGVGGDYYDFFEVDGDRVAVIIGDVSGKGISGAFVMVNIRSIFQHNITKFMITPAEMVTIINEKMLADSTNDFFAVLSVYIFNKKDRSIEYCNAGYGPMTYYSAAKKRVVELPYNSLPAGVIDDESKYVNRHLQLAPGDIILSNTDGLLESFELKHDRHGKEILYRLIQDLADQSASTIKQAIVAEIAGVVGTKQQRDDISLLIARVTDLI